MCGLPGQGEVHHDPTMQVMLMIVRGCMTFMNYPEITAQKLSLMDGFQTFYAMDMLQMHDTFLQAPLHL